MTATERIKSNSHSIYWTVIIVLVLCTVYVGNHAPTPVAVLPINTISENIKLAYIPETNEYLFIDRKTNTVTQVIAPDIAEKIVSIGSDNKQRGYESAISSSSKKGANQAQQK